MFSSPGPRSSNIFNLPHPSTMPPKDFSIRVTLTSLRDPNDRRYITLSSTEPCIIGRASKSAEKNLQAGPKNALFDCPVVSRKHAEIRSSPWAPIGDQVNIIDFGSMHGTRVNGTLLEKGKKMSLRSGDMIQFGERVTRGEDTHEGVVVTFDRVSPNMNNTQGSHTFAASQPYFKRGYSVPSYASDEDESDSRSDDGLSLHSDDEDDEREAHPSSSAHTTPEQNKAELGSAQKPIDLDSTSAPPRVIRAEIVDLVDEDEEMPAPPKPSKEGEFSQMMARVAANGTSVFGTRQEFPSRIHDSQKMIPDSVDQDNSVFELANVARAAALRGQLNLEDDADMTSHKFGLADVLDKNATESVSGQSESENGIDDAEYDIGSEGDDRGSEPDDRALLSVYDRTVRNDVPGGYYSEAESPYDVASENEDEEEDEEEEPELSYSMHKEPSAELGSTSGFAGCPSDCVAPRCNPALQKTAMNAIDDLFSTAAEETSPSPQQAPAAVPQPKPFPGIPQSKPFPGIHGAYEVTSPVATGPEARSFYKYQNPQYQNPSSNNFGGPFNVPPPFFSRGMANGGAYGGAFSGGTSYGEPTRTISCFGGPNEYAFRSSRWDVGPRQQAPLPGPPGSTYWNPSSQAYEVLPPAFPQKSTAPSLPNSMRIASDVFGFQHSWGGAPPVPQQVQEPYFPKSPSLGAFSVAKEMAPRNYMPDAPAEQVDATPKNKISIANIVEDQAFEDGREEALQKLKAAGTLAGAKRKAAEMVAETAAEMAEEPSSSSVSSSSSAAATTGANEVTAANMWGSDLSSELEDIYGLSELDDDEPVPRRRKVGLEPDAYVSTPAALSEPNITPSRIPVQKQGGSRIAGAAKVAGGAVLGGVATMAFLISPLAERAIEWLA